MKYRGGYMKFIFKFIGKVIYGVIVKLLTTALTILGLFLFACFLLNVDPFAILNEIKEYIWLI